MTAVPEVTPAQEAPPAEIREAAPYSERLVLHVSTDARKRLRLAAAVEDRPMGHLADEIFRRELPTSAELARQLHQNGEPDDDQG
jgi:hypothetical protein